MVLDRLAQILGRQDLQFPIQVKVMTEEETKEYHLKKLYELSLKTIGVIPQLEEPNDEQKEWVIHKMKASKRAWQRWFVGLYFTEEQKREMGLTDKDIA